jgi:hypothetical protein
MKISEALTAAYVKKGLPKRNLIDGIKPSDTPKTVKQIRGELRSAATVLFGVSIDLDPSRPQTALPVRPPEVLRETVRALAVSLMGASLDIGETDINELRRALSKLQKENAALQQERDYAVNAAAEYERKERARAYQRKRAVQRAESAAPKAPREPRPRVTQEHTRELMRAASRRYYAKKKAEREALKQARQSSEVMHGE